MDQPNQEHHYEPHSIEMEKSLLGSAIYANQMPLITTGRCNEDWFHDKNHRALWSICKKIYESQGELDELLLMAELGSSKTYSDIFGNPVEFVMSFDTGGAMHSHYMAVVKEKYNHRSIIKELRFAIESAARPSTVFSEVKSAISPILDKLFSLSIADEGKSDASLIDEFIERKTKEADGMIEQVPAEFIVHTGMPNVETLFGQIDSRDRDNLIVIGAESSRGKSAAMRQIVNENLRAHDDWVIVCFLLESSKEDFWHNCACSFAQINTRKPADKWTAEERSKYFSHINLIKSKTGINIFLFDASATMLEIKGRCKEIKAKTGRLDLVMLDYLQIVERPRHGSPESEVAGISRETKNLQKSIKCPVFTGTQLNESGKVRESRAIFNDATRVWIIDRPDKTPDGSPQTEGFKCDFYFQTIDQQKYRNGRLAKAGICFQVTTQQMFDWV